MDVFSSADDRQGYLELLSQSASKHALDFLAWCLISNHAHFVVVRRQERSLARTFEKRIGIFREGWRGPLWQERFDSYPMDERRAMKIYGLSFLRGPCLSDNRSALCGVCVRLKPKDR
jgi:hypothetical protein